jgi:hypothetical protein
VVGHVDGQRDRAHAGQRQPPLQPGRRARRRVEAAHDAGDVAVAAVRRLDPHAGTVRRRSWGRDEAGIGQRQPEGRGGLPGHPAHRQGVAPVRRHGDVQHLVTQLQELDDVGADRGVGRQHEDAVGVTAQAELGGRADHPVGGVAVGLPGADRDAARQHGAGQGEGHAVARREVRRAADDLVHPLGHLDVAEPDGLLEPGQLLDVEHLADHHAGDVVADAVDLLDLEPGADERPGDLVARGRQARDQCTEPGDGDAHLRPPSRAPA